MREELWGGIYSKRHSRVNLNSWHDARNKLEENDQIKINPHPLHLLFLSPSLQLNVLDTPRRLLAEWPLLLFLKGVLAHWRRGFTTLCELIFDNTVVLLSITFSIMLACLHGCTEEACIEAEWMNGSIVTVFWAWFAEMSWKIWEGASGVQFYCFGLDSVKKKLGKGEPHHSQSAKLVGSGGTCCMWS